MMTSKGNENLVGCNISDDESQDIISLQNLAIVSSNTPSIITTGAARMAQSFGITTKSLFCPTEKIKMLKVMLKEER